MNLVTRTQTFVAAYYNLTNSVLFGVEDAKRSFLGVLIHFNFGKSVYFDRKKSKNHGKICIVT